jgi:hypothetical protein
MENTNQKILNDNIIKNFYAINSYMSFSSIYKPSAKNQKLNTFKKTKLEIIQKIKINNFENSKFMMTIESVDLDCNTDELVFLYAITRAKEETVILSLEEIALSLNVSKEEARKTKTAERIKNSLIKHEFLKLEIRNKENDSYNRFSVISQHSYDSNKKEFTITFTKDFFEFYKSQFNNIIYSESFKKVKLEYSKFLLSLFSNFDRSNTYTLNESVILKRLNINELSRDIKHELKNALTELYQIGILELATINKDNSITFRKNKLSNKIDSKNLQYHHLSAIYRNKINNQETFEYEDDEIPF